MPCTHKCRYCFEMFRPLVHFLHFFYSPARVKKLCILRTFQVLPFHFHYLCGKTVLKQLPNRTQFYVCTNYMSRDSPGGFTKRQQTEVCLINAAIYNTYQLDKGTVLNCSNLYYLYMNICMTSANNNVSALCLQLQLHGMSDQLTAFLPRLLKYCSYITILCRLYQGPRRISSK